MQFLPSAIQEATSCSSICPYLHSQMGSHQCSPHLDHKKDPPWPPHYLQEQELQMSPTHHPFCNRCSYSYTPMRPLSRLCKGTTIPPGHTISYPSPPQTGAQSYSTPPLTLKFQIKAKVVPQPYTLPRPDYGMTGIGNIFCATYTALQNMIFLVF